MFVQICSTWIVIKEKQIKTTMSYHYSRMAKIKKTINTKCKSTRILSLLIGEQKGAAAVEKYFFQSCEILQTYHMTQLFHLRILTLKIWNTYFVKKNHLPKNVHRCLYTHWQSIRWNRDIHQMAGRRLIDIVTYSYNRAPFQNIKTRISITSAWVSVINIMWSKIKDKRVCNMLFHLWVSEIAKTS